MIKYIIAFMLVFTTAAFAQDNPFSKISTMPDVITSIKGLADDNVDKGQDSEGHNLAPISADEKVNGIIPLEKTKQVIDFGVFTAYAEECGYSDWEEKIFIPFMNRERESKKWNDRQLAYIGMIHGISMGYMEKQLKKVPGGCIQKDQDNVDAYFKSLGGKK